MPFSRRTFLWLPLAASATVFAQSIAHPGWRGNAIAPEAWWKHAAFVRFPASTTFAQATEAMQAMSEAGADSLILPDPQPTPGAAIAGTAMPFDARFGTEDDLDALLREASARHMHVVFQMPLLQLAGNRGKVRFWMSRGIAGFDVGEVRAAELDTLQLLRDLVKAFPGQRVLLASTPEVPFASGMAARRSAGQGSITLQLTSLTNPEIPGASANQVLPQAIELTAAECSTGPKFPPDAVPIVPASLLTDDVGRQALRRLLSSHRPAPRHAAARRGRRRPE